MLVLVGGTQLLRGVFLGNYVGPRGSYTGTVVGVRPWVVAPAIWSLVVAVAVVSAVMAVVLAAAAIARVRARHRARARAPRHPAAATLTLTYASAYVALTVALAVFTTSPFFDRYLVPVVPAMAATVLWAWQRVPSIDGSRGAHSGRLTAWASGVVTAFVAVVALSLVVTSAQFDAAKWRLGEQLEARGWSAPTIDAGFEWFGFHQEQPIDPHPRALPGYSLLGEPSLRAPACLRHGVPRAGHHAGERRRRRRAGFGVGSARRQLRPRRAARRPRLPSRGRALT